MAVGDIGASIVIGATVAGGFRAAIGSSVRHFGALSQSVEALEQRSRRVAGARALQNRTPMRSKAFHDYMWGKHGEFALEDHVVAIRQLGERHPWLDPERVGITGHSWGGYSSAVAMLRYPDFYRVGVSSAGVYDYRYLYPVFVRWTGAPEFEGGGSLAPDDTARPVNWVAPAGLAENLAGKLLLVHGDLDENTLPASTLTLVDALVQANRDFDLLTLLNRDHNYTNETCFIRRRWDYFVEHLLGAEPPAGYRVSYDD